MLKKMISTSKLHANHPFAGQITQQHYFYKFIEKVGFWSRTKITEMNWFDIRRIEIRDYDHIMIMKYVYDLQKYTRSKFSNINLKIFFFKWLLINYVTVEGGALALQWRAPICFNFAFKSLIQQAFYILSFYQS